MVVVQLTCRQDGCDRDIAYKKAQLCKSHYNLAWAKANPEKMRMARYKYYKKNIEWYREQSRQNSRINARNLVVEEDFTPDVRERFMAKVQIEGTCWVWTAARAAWRPQRMIAGPTPGYGVFSVNKRPFYAHRASWLMHNGPLIPGLVIDHLCNNTLCVNPEHLQQVTSIENAQRSENHPMNKKYTYFKSHCKYGHPRGEAMKGKPCETCYPRKKNGSN